MPIVTVEDAIELAMPAGSRIIAVADGVAREVTWASVLHSVLPTIEGVEVGELVLIDQELISTLDENAAEDLFNQLHNHGVSALAIVGEPSLEMMAMAEELSLPLIALPPSTRLQQTERAIMALIVNRRAELERRGVQVYRQLAQIEIEDQGLPYLVDALVEITHKAVALQDENLDLRHFVAPPESILTWETAASLLRDKEALDDWLKDLPLVSTSPPIGHFSRSGETIARYVAPIIIRGTIAGYVSVIGHSRDLTEMDRVATGRAGSVFAIEIAKQRAIIEAENRMRGDFVDDLLAGSFTTEEAAISRAKLLGYDLRPPYAILVYGWDQPMVDLQSQYGDGYVQRLRIALDLALGDGLSAEGRKALLRVRNDQAYVAYPAAQMDTTEVERVAERLRQRVLARSDSAPISVGVSPTFSLLGAAPTAFHQAEQALTIAQRLFGGNRAIHFDRLGVYRLLFPLRDRPELQQFYDEMLRALNEYDQRHGSNLVGTLREYFIHHGNLSKVSEALFVHRNTLSYRLERIQLISGRNLEDAEDRLSLHWA